MTSSEYQKLAARTIPDGMSKLDMGFHGILGLVSEVEEYLKAYEEYTDFITSTRPPVNHEVEAAWNVLAQDLENHVVSELGDMFWFLAELCTANDLDLSDFKDNSDLETVKPIHDTIGEIAAIYQKTYQGHPINEEMVKTNLTDLAVYLAWQCKDWDARPEEVWQQNIAKLTARYPDGFDAEHSLHRAEGDI